MTEEYKVNGRYTEYEPSFKANGKTYDLEALLDVNNAVELILGMNKRDPSPKYRPSTKLPCKSYSGRLPRGDTHST